MKVVSEQKRRRTDLEATGTTGPTNAPTRPDLGCQFHSYPKGFIHMRMAEHINQGGYAVPLAEAVCSGLFWY